MQLAPLLIVGGLFLVFLIIGILSRSIVSIIIALVFGLLIFYMISDSGVQYPSGVNANISKDTQNNTLISQSTTYETLDTRFSTPLITLFAIICLWLVVVIFNYYTGE